ncbi:MAG: cytochrome c biogenesis protein CcsA [Desulfurococcales archaeon]|nr:cytochrome c biogenesis protein CcsA [Desulfurococcales archaeon]
MELAGLHYATILPLASAAALVLALEMDLFWGTGERLFKAGLILALAGWPVYLVAFMLGDYTLAEVSRTVSDGLDFIYRIAAGWSSGGSSLYTFAAILSLALLIALVMGGGGSRSFRLAGESLMLTVLAAAALNGAFETMPEGVGGRGLNPLLKSYWAVPHPLATFTGYSMILSSTLLLLTAKSPAWRPLLLLGWAFLSLGLLLGGYWSYDTFGWGGYWAWDPVETSQLMVWLGAAALAHSIGPLAPLRRLVAGLTGGSVLLALYVTRSGFSPLHSFAAPDLGAAVLLAYSIPLTLAGIYFFASRDFELLAKSTSKIIGKGSGLTVKLIALGGLAIFFSFIYVYSSLLAPSIASVAGFNVSAPLGDAGTRFYNPVLLAAAAIALIALPGSLASRSVEAKVFLPFAAATVALAGAAASLALAGVLVYSPKSDPLTNAMVASGLVVATASLTLLALTTIPSLRTRNPRWILVRLVHAGVILTLIGVLASGSYAYNQGYIEEVTLRPGETVNLGYAKITLLEYEYVKGPVGLDVKSHVTASPVAIAAWTALSALQGDLGRVAGDVLEVAKGGLTRELRVLEEIITSPTRLDGKVDVYGIGRIEVFTPSSAVKEVLEGEIKLTIYSPGLELNVEPLGEGDEVSGGVLKAYVRAEDLWVEPSPAPRDSYYYYRLKFEEPVEIAFGSLTLNVEELTIYPLPQAPRENSIGPALLVVDTGYIDYKDVEIKVPLTLGEGEFLYLKAASGESRLLSELLDSGLAEALSRGEALELDPRPGRLDLPERVLEWVGMKVKLRVEVNGDTEVLEAFVRFEGNGEVLGIRGLVLDVLQVQTGLGDLYITVAPPIVREGTNVYHTLLIYYLREAYESLDFSQRLSLTALMAAAYNSSLITSGTAGNEAVVRVLESLIDLYRMATTTGDGDNPVESQGVVLQVKMVPMVDLVWAGGAVTVASMLALAFISGAQRQDSST